MRYYSLKDSALPPQMSPFRDSAVSFFGARADARASDPNQSKCHAERSRSTAFAQAEALVFDSARLNGTGRLRLTCFLKFATAFTTPYSPPYYKNTK
jgi:hypothetical protein